MQGPLYFGLAFAMLILENLWRAQWPIHGLAPQFTLLLVAFMGLTEHGLAGLFYAFGLGIAMDALAGTVPGFTAVAYIITYVF
ncbi:hypothetical protein KDL45_15135, partial [bacterium]|nr:hypothetical protein [bacterium]